MILLGRFLFWFQRLKIEVIEKRDMRWVAAREIVLTKIVHFVPELNNLLPGTLKLLQSSNLVLHDNVSGVVMHGSRGLKGGARPGSDLDLSLIVDCATRLRPDELPGLLQQVTETTLTNWQGKVELDLAAVFDVQNCGLKCFEWRAWDEGPCLQGGAGCFGLFKTQKGFKGLVTDAGVQVRLMYPCLKIWSRNIPYSDCRKV